jgi:hypothetical protein
MNKSIFISHSSKDSESLIRYKNKLLMHYKDVSVFLSSDGSSIRLGKNWSKEIEDGLEKSDLALIFLTENSLYNNWVHFETGYVYAKKDKSMIPIVTESVKFEQLKAPLNLYQSLYLKDKNGLIRIQEEIFQRLGLKDEQSWTDDDYREIFGDVSDNYQEALNDIEIHIELSGDREKIIKSVYDFMKKVYQIAIHKHENGITEYMWAGGIANFLNQEIVSVFFSSINWINNLQIFNLCEDTIDGLSGKKTFSCVLTGWRTYDKMIDIYGAIEKTEIRLQINESLQYEKLQFTLSNQKNVDLLYGVEIKLTRVLCTTRIFPTPEEIKNLISELIRTQIIIKT